MPLGSVLGGMKISSQVERSNRRIRHGTDVFRTGIQKESVGSVTERNVFSRGPIGSLLTDSCRISEEISDRFDLIRSTKDVGNRSQSIVSDRIR